MTLTFQIQDGDIPFSSATGRPFTLEGTAKFVQDIGEVLDVGAQLDGVVGLVGDVFSLRAEMSRRIDGAFAAYKAAQDTIQRSDRLPEERFNRTVQVLVFPVSLPGSSAIVSTSYAWRVDVLSTNGNTSTISGQLLGP